MIEEEHYLRRYLNDKEVPETVTVQAEIVDDVPDNDDTRFFRRYLNDKGEGQ